MNRKLVPALALATSGIVALLAVACTNSTEPAAGANQSLGTAPSAQAAPTLTAFSPAVRAAGDSSQTGIWVTGSGSVSAAPDLALINLGIEGRARTVSDARAQAAAAMDKVMQALTARKVAAKDVQTTSYTISPEYNYREVVDSLGRRTERVLLGYIVANQVTVKVRDLNAAGPIIDDVAAAGGDLARVNSISFTIDDPTPLQKQARDLAMADAKARAGQLATGAGVALGRAFYISESMSVPIVKDFAERSVAAMPTAAPTPTPISSGKLQVTVTVQAAFALQ
jgi:uncharacterized protein YggE